MGRSTDKLFVSKILIVAAALVFSNAAHAQTMPACRDKAILEKVSLIYRSLETNSQHSKILDYGEIRETGLGPPPPAANQYANDESYISETRYCESVVSLEDGEKDTIYWTIHHFKEHGEDSFRPDACSLKHDSWEDGCEQWRPAK